MTSPFNNLRSQVFRRAAETMSLFVSTKALFAQPKISNSNMAFSVKEDIFWLQISIYNSCSVKAADCIDNFSSIYLSSLFIKSLFFPQICEKFTTVEEINDEVEFRFCLECIMKPHNIWIFDFFQNVSFSYNFQSEQVRYIKK